MNYSTESNKRKKRENKSAAKKLKNKTGLIIVRVLIIAFLAVCFAGGGAMIGVYLGIIQKAEKIENIKVLPNVYTTIVYEAKTGDEIDRYSSEENREYITSDKIPVNMKNAIVAIEDERFFQHNGVDIKGMIRAVVVTLTSRSGRTEGASTITQQLIKNTVTKVTHNSIVTKLQEQYIAVEYEKSLIEELGSKAAAKDHILEVYLNAISLNHGLYGIQTASQYYLGKDASELTLSECAMIAAITNNPTKYSPDNHPDYNKDRQSKVLRNMLDLKMITQEQYNEAIADNVYERVGQSTADVAEQTQYHSYFNDALFKQVSKDLQEKYKKSEADADHMIYTGGLRIYSTQDMDMQRIADEAYMDDKYFPSQGYEIVVEYTLKKRNTVTGKTSSHTKTGKVYNTTEIDGYVETVKNELLGNNDEIISEQIIPIPQPQSAMVIMDYHNGQVKAIVGGRGEKLTNRALNRATDSARSPGSVFKVLASYAPALDMGLITPATIIDDAPYTVAEYNNYTPKNWYPGFRGPATVRVGIRDSMNILAVKNIMNTGIQNCFDYLLQFGFTTLENKNEAKGKLYSDKFPSIALGGLTQGVTQLEVAAAFSAIANGGEYNEPVLYTKVLDHEGNVILENTPEPRTVLKSTTAYLLTDMMKDVVTSGTGTKARFKEIKMPVSGKTGTSQNTHNLTFAGYTPYYAASIWLGYDLPKPLKEEEKGFHLQLWSAIMERIHKEMNLPYKDFEMPDGIVKSTICRDSGKLCVSGLCDSDERGSRAYTELFVAGTQPSEYCDVHVRLTVDTSTHMKAGPFCPEEFVKDMVGIIRYNTDYDEDGNPLDLKEHEILASAIDGPECTVHSSNPDYTLPDDFWKEFGNEDLNVITPYSDPSGFPTIVPTPNPDIVNGTTDIPEGMEVYTPQLPVTQPTANPLTGTPRVPSSGVSGAGSQTPQSTPTAVPPFPVAQQPVQTESPAAQPVQTGSPFVDLPGSIDAFKYNNN